MFKYVKGVFASLLACVSTLVLAAVKEDAQLAPTPTVDVGWVYFFGFVFIAICAWFGYAIWRADKPGAEDQGERKET